MTETLTDTQTPATRRAMAPAAPDTDPAAPEARQAAPGAPAAVPPGPRKGGRGRPGMANAPLSTAPATGHPAPATEATPQAPLGARTVGWLLLAVAVIGMPLVGIIGFAASYSTLERFALTHGFSATLAAWFPIGIDASIVALLAMDLVMVRRRTPWPVLRLSAHAMTLATVLFNAADGLSKEGPDKGLWAGLAANPLWALSHAVMPVLFVLGVEAARRLLMHTARIEDGTASDRIPLHRWALSPIRTGKLYRRMRLATVRSYEEMVEREQALAGYEVWLRHKHGGDLSRATEEERLPMTMAPRGYTVEEALALPAKWAAEQAERDRRQAERDRAEAERERLRVKADRIAALTDEAEIEEAEHRVTARTGTAKAQAEAAKAEAEAETAAAKARAEQHRRAAERQALTEAQALESAEAAAAKRRAADDLLEAERAEAEAIRLRDQNARALVEAERREQQAERIADDRKAAAAKAAQDERDAVAAALEATRLRAEAARIEAAAVEAEDYARLSPRERNERRVARMLLEAVGFSEGVTLEAVPLADIQSALGVGRTTASELRSAALTLLQNGYHPNN
ncbi:DUF2637 domain-containing protein [Streptomyces sp. CAI 127]|uniref:DUF2637 domain-containing protein n=1 Tax=Streptomyces sp. CAI 127 TaxID=1076397 RepID=UPI0015871690|nr:DUF2637 domain-containing protein [Streptomyces sp. CAI 127]NUW04319.1 DUF2637 domain-containing protein [Streptomyces sp. CAI 127]